ncbi:unnamed protein product, partial [Didymodactylos carnosus]
HSLNMHLLGRILYGSVLIAIACGYTTLAPNQKKLLRSLELLKQTEAEQTFNQALTLAIESNPELTQHKAVLLKFFQKHFAFNSLKYDIAKLYMEHFTLKEINQLIKFYSEPL